MSGIVIASRCNWCSRSFGPADSIFLSTGQMMCHKCHANHHVLLNLLSADVPKACGECRITSEQLNVLHKSSTTRMFLVNKDGIYQLLCPTCKDTYCAKRADLFKGTQFGQEMKL